GRGRRPLRHEPRPRAPLPDGGGDAQLDQVRAELPGLIKISACIICFNEEANIRACLESVKFLDEIVVVDSGSKDRTLEIARELTGRVVERAWPGHIEQKNFAVDAAAN